jgi:putative transposase
MYASLRAAVAEVRRHGDLYFAAFLPEDRILNAFDRARWLWQGWIYTPAVTVWVFLSQCFSADHSCRDAVSRLMAWRIARGQKACSPDTGAYCTARDKLPEAACHQLVRETGRECEQRAAESWLWLGRRVRAVDGTTVTMPDTAANQAAYPQQKNQKAGCGFPIVRLVVVFSLAVGTVLDAALGKYEGKQTGENSLFRQLHGLLDEGDVVLADRYFGGWFDIALLRQRGVDVVVRKHQMRPTDFRTGTRLGKDDHLVRWSKPQRPEWMTAEQYATLPAELELREIRIRVRQPGFRTRSVLAVTTLLDPVVYSAEELAKLYRQRWQAELHLRSIKIVLQMDHLRCKTPERVRNEIWTHLLGYNLVRAVMAMAAHSADTPPWCISFKGTLQILNAFLPMLHGGVNLDCWCQALLKTIASDAVGDRPNRFEPRVRKRRPKPYKNMREPRHNYRNRMRRGC